MWGAAMFVSRTGRHGQAKYGNDRNKSYVQLAQILISYAINLTPQHFLMMQSNLRYARQKLTLTAANTHCSMASPHLRSLISHNTTILLFLPVRWIMSWCLNGRSLVACSSSRRLWHCFGRPPCLENRAAWDVYEGWGHIVRSPTIYIHTACASIGTRHRSLLGRAV